MANTTVSRVRTKDGIEFHCERTQGINHNAPDLILIPSGEGDCAIFTHVVPLLARNFTVTTFDMPGMSRSTAPTSAVQDITASKLAAQIAGLLDELSIEKTTVWGCSSGGLAALALAIDWPERIRNLIIHEVPDKAPDFLLSLLNMDDESIVNISRAAYTAGFEGNEDAWDSLGADWLNRLDKNFVTWVRTYVGKVEKSWSTEELRKRPVTWTIGGMTPAEMFWQNVIDGFDAGVRIGLLPSKHFPQVTVPEVLAEHIVKATEAHL